MAFELIETSLNDAFIIKPHKFEDDRGIYEKNFEYNILKRKGITFNIVESSDLYTKKGAIRGLHYQNGESQAKLVRVVYGKVFDVIIDLRKDSTTFGKTFSIILESDTNMSLYIPRGFAHGFLALEDSIFAYYCDGKYEPLQCGGLLWNDAQLNIKWPLEKYGIKKLIISEKDKKWPSFKTYLNID